MNQFEQLAQTVIDDQQERKARTNKTEQVKKIEGLVIRLYKSGEVYPSQELVSKFNLEYKSKDNPDQGQAVDLIDSTEWTPIANHPRTILISFTDRNNPKTDLFSATRWEEDQPINSVFNQGTKSQDLLDIARSLGWFGTDDKAKYVDLQVMVQYGFKTKDGIAYLPKVVARGEKKGDKTYERRENQTFYPITPVIQQVETTTQTKAVETTADIIAK